MNLFTTFRLALRALWRNKVRSSLTMLGVAGVNYVMGVPGADDVMLNYQSTSFHDSHYLRQALGLRLSRLRILKPLYLARRRWLLARIGGEEFAVLLAGLAGALLTGIYAFRLLFIVFLHIGEYLVHLVFQ